VTACHRNAVVPAIVREHPRLRANRLNGEEAEGAILSDFVVERVLLTNDDGIDAQGIKVLEEAAATIAREVWVVAPEHDQSGVSHSISLHHPLRVSTKSTRKFGVFGTPGDCVAIAVHELMRDSPPDLILSGINAGSNLGVETVFSGTVGAAMAGMLLGFRSIALSQVFTRPNPIRWETASALAPGVLRKLTTMEWPAGCCLNVNFPDFPASESRPMLFTEQGPGLMEGLHVERRADPRGVHYYWLNIRRGAQKNPENSETAVVREGGVSVTPLQFERTNAEALSMLKRSAGYLAPANS
jgi:5'-nucleotidase